jgi:hypothetical protein
MRCKNQTVLFFLKEMLCHKQLNPREILSKIWNIYFELNSRISRLDVTISSQKLQYAKTVKRLKLGTHEISFQDKSPIITCRIDKEYDEKFIVYNNCFILPPFKEMLN